jgi:predicted dehydrogenase
MHTSIRIAFIGYGQRGREHVLAYRGLKDAKIVAISELDEKRRASAIKENKVKGYKNYNEMLEKEHPDIVHVVTKEDIPRAIWVEPVVNSGAKILVIEKPIARFPSEMRALEDALLKTNNKLKIIVSHQRRYMPFAIKLRELMANGSFGQICFVRASTQGVVLDMYPHLMDLVLMTVRDVAPTAVWAVAEGSSYYETYRPCPDNLMATYTFPSGVRVFYESALKTFGTADIPYPYPEDKHDWHEHRCEIDIWATKGRFWWRENGTWGYRFDNINNSFTEMTRWERDNMPAQRNFSKAIIDWLKDLNKPHLCSFENAKLGFDSLMAAYHSALLGKRLLLPTTFTDTEWKQLRNKLTSNNPSKVHKDSVTARPVMRQQDLTESNKK